MMWPHTLTCLCHFWVTPAYWEQHPMPPESVKKQNISVISGWPSRSGQIGLVPAKFWAQGFSSRFGSGLPKFAKHKPIGFPLCPSLIRRHSYMVTVAWIPFVWIFLSVLNVRYLWKLFSSSCWRHLDRMDKWKIKHSSVPLILYVTIKTCWLNDGDPFFIARFFKKDLIVLILVSACSVPQGYHQSPLCFRKIACAHLRSCF